MAHLLKYDSVLGMLPNTIKAHKDGISVDGDELQGAVRARPEAELPWGDLGVDVVIESTGIFTKRDTAAAHLEAGAPLVIVSAPCDGADATFVYGVNHKDFDPKTAQGHLQRQLHHQLLRAAGQGARRRLRRRARPDATVHAYTGDQMLVDGPHSDLRRARAAAINIIPTSTGAARATSLVLASMKGKLDGTSLRVPGADRLDRRLHRQPEDGRDRRRRSTRRSRRPRASGPLKGILRYTRGADRVERHRHRPAQRASSTPGSR